MGMSIRTTEQRPIPAQRDLMSANMAALASDGLSPQTASQPLGHPSTPACKRLMIALWAKDGNQAAALWP